MATATITFTDTVDGSADVRVDFDGEGFDEKSLAHIYAANFLQTLGGQEVEPEESH
jgi:hypothetical protein